jgi:acyl carrier protein phosphodiesterase
MLPVNSSRFLEYVIKNNIYKEYSSLQGIQTVLNHLSHRIKHRVQLDDSIILFKKNEPLLEANFNLFFSDVLKEFTHEL